LEKLFIGLISGTSIDSVDGALVSFSEGRPRLIAKHAEPIPADLRESILALAHPGDNELDRMAQLDSTVARLFAKNVGALLGMAGVAPNSVRAIGSHGQTVRHAPSAPEPYTVQIGNPSLIAELTSISTVADFRRRDMAAGGQGAPLAPAFHAAFLGTPDETRVVVNIGGMANITALPKDARLPASGFDTGPGNVLLDGWAHRHLGEPFDRDGAWAAGGKVLTGLLNRLLEDPYFMLPPPKSTGREAFNLVWLDAALGCWDAAAPTRDVQATLAALTARSVAMAIQSHAPNAERVLVCGGGVHNHALLNALQRQCSPIPVESTATQDIDPDYLEAVGFAWLAMRTLEGRPGNLPEVTGARGERILGGIYPG
jgi:anhydro-N-acetylmuramic acid kinase